MLVASRDVIVSSQICVSKLQRFFTLGDGCWLPKQLPKCPRFASVQPFVVTSFYCEATIPRTTVMLLRLSNKLHHSHVAYEWCSEFRVPVTSRIRVYRWGGGLNIANLLPKWRALCNRVLLLQIGAFKKATFNAKLDFPIRCCDMGSHDEHPRACSHLCSMSREFWTCGMGGVLLVCKCASVGMSHEKCAVWVEMWGAFGHASV